jgi:polar amino acid transport system permease protein
MQAIAEFFQWLNDAHGVNFSIFYDSFDQSRFVEGIWTTIKLSVICLVLSIVIGIVGAWLQGSKLKVTRRIVQGYIQFFRNTPPLVQLFFFYFAIGSVLPAMRDAHGQMVPVMTNFGWAVISFSFFAGAFNVEIFRAGIQAVPRATVEAAEALGYSRLKAYIHIVLPLAFRISLPALNNNLVNLVKTTTQAIAIAVPELLYQMVSIWNDYASAQNAAMTVLFVVYILLVGILAFGMNRWERALYIPGFGGGR